jgi:HSP20 family protein
MNETVRSTDVHEIADAFLVTMRLPGVSADEVSINIVGNTVTVTGELQEEREERAANGHWILRERRFGAFERVLTLPMAVEPTSASEIADGALKMTLTKVTELAKKEAANLNP